MIEQLMFFGQLAEIGLLFKIAFTLGQLSTEIKDHGRRIDALEAA